MLVVPVRAAGSSDTATGVGVTLAGRGRLGRLGQRRRLQPRWHSSLRAVPCRGSWERLRFPVRSRPLLWGTASVGRGAAPVAIGADAAAVAGSFERPGSLLAGPVAGLLAPDGSARGEFDHPHVALGWAERLGPACGDEAAIAATGGARAAASGIQYHMKTAPGVACQWSSSFTGPWGLSGRAPWRAKGRRYLPGSGRPPSVRRKEGEAWRGAPMAVRRFDERTGGSSGPILGAHAAKAGWPGGLEAGVLQRRPAGEYY